MEKLSVAVVGLGHGTTHARACAASERYQIVGLCDMDSARLNTAHEALGGARAYQDYARMLDMERPDVVAIATPTACHAAMALQAARAGAKGIYLEKPIAANLNDARAIADLCASHGVKLLIGHQRRVSAPYRAMRRLIESGAIGKVERVRGTCPGDLLTDGSHLIDSALYLLGDEPPEWVLGQVFRGRKAAADELAVNPYLYHGDRYGHPVEEGAMAVVGIRGGARLELYTGTVSPAGAGYQHIEVEGSAGRILRPSDGADPAALLDRGAGWESVPCDGADDGFAAAFELGADYFAGITDSHPMDLAHAMVGFELMMAICESARTHSRLSLPAQTDADPLARMIREGQME